MGAKRFQTKKRLAGRQLLQTSLLFWLDWVLSFKWQIIFLLSFQNPHVLALPRVHSGRISSTPCWTLRVARRSACQTYWTWQRGAGRPSRRGRGCRKAWTRRGSSWSGGLHSLGGELCKTKFSMWLVLTNNNHVDCIRGERECQFT